MQQKKEILFIMPYLGCGGVESTLFSLLDVIDKEKFNITLLLLENKGAFKDRIPNGITVKEATIPEREWGVFFGKKNQLLDYIKAGKPVKAVKSFLYNRRNSITENRTNNAEYFERIIDSVPNLEGHYDLAIDYFGYSTFTTVYLAEKVNADIKVSWLHSIFSRFEPQKFEKWYAKMDVIYACSKVVKEDFEKIFPNIKCVECFYNIINPNNIILKSNGKSDFKEDNKIKILTVGRVCEEKGLDIAVDVCRKLVNDKLNFKWYIVGPYEDSYVKSITSNMTDEEKSYLAFLGTKSNPYPYMKNCDIYVQPSRFEGYCTTTNEARIIGCPIVMTDVSGAQEQIINGKTGFITDIDSQSLYEKIKVLIEEPDIRDGFKENLKNIDCDTRKEVEKLYALLEK